MGRGDLYRGKLGPIRGETSEISNLKLGFLCSSFKTTVEVICKSLKKGEKGREGGWMLQARKTRAFLRIDATSQCAGFWFAARSRVAGFSREEEEDGVGSMLYVCCMYCFD